jgi:hypothetical protein
MLDRAGGLFIRVCNREKAISKVMQRRRQEMGNIDIYKKTASGGEKRRKWGNLSGSFAWLLPLKYSFL